MGFNLVNLAITIRSDNCFKLASLLPLSGGAFSTVCKHLCCQHSNYSCEHCISRLSCSWLFLFGQELTCDVAALKRHQKPPLPFVFSFPCADTTFSSCTELVCGLVVIGSAIAHTQLLLQGFAELLIQNTYQLKAEICSVACRDYLGQIQKTASVTVPNSLPTELVVASMDGILESRVVDNTELDLKFTSPLRLIEDGRPLARFEFGRFARSVMRRVSSLSYYYGECELDWDFKELSRLIDNVICTEDAFTFSKHPKIQLSGIVGFGCFLGEFRLLIPFLVIGSLVHTGKGATYGLGAYEVISSHQ